MKKKIFLTFLLFISLTCIFSQRVFVEIRKNFRDNYSLKIKVDTIFENLYLDIENSYASLVDQDSIDLGNYEIFHFNHEGLILGEFLEKNSDEIKFVRLNLIFIDSILNVKEQKPFYYELYVKEKKFLLKQNIISDQELKVYFSDNTLSRAFIWTEEGKLAQALDIYSGVYEKINPLLSGVYFLRLSGFSNIEKIFIR